MSYCDYCHKEFEPSKFNRNQRYCSDKCQHAAYMAYYNKHGRCRREVLSKLPCPLCGTITNRWAKNKNYPERVCEVCDRKLNEGVPIASQLINDKGGVYHGCSWWVGRKIGKNVVVNIPFEPLCDGVYTETKITVKCPLGHEFEKPVITAGSACPVCLEKCKKNKEEFAKANLEGEASIDEWSDIWYDYTGIKILSAEKDHWSYGEKIYVQAKCWCGREWSVLWSDVTKKRITSCGCIHVMSQANDEIAQFCEQHGLKVIQEHPVENTSIDIYLPECNLAIEHNGLNWHEDRKDLKKYNLCGRYGIQYFGIYEDEWKHRKDFIKSMILRRAGVSASNRVILDASKLNFSHANSKEVIKEFLLKQSILIPDETSINYSIGAYDGEGRLVALCACGPHHPGSLEILNLSCDYGLQIDGLWKTMWEWIIHNLSVRKATGYTANRIEDGANFIEMGFKKVKTLDPRWFWIHGKKRLPQDVHTSTGNGWHQLYDCGRTVWNWDASS